MPRFELSLLGPPHVEYNGARLKLYSRKAFALLAYLAMNPHHHRRDSLVNLLWPDSTRAKGKACLRTSLYDLKQALDGDLFETDRETITLRSDSDVGLDVSRFQSLITGCGTHGHAPDDVCSRCTQPLDEAVSVYGGDFLEGFGLKNSVNFDDWQRAQAEKLRADLDGAFDRLIRCSKGEGEYTKAIAYARQWLPLDRMNESAHRLLIDLYARSGKRAASLRQYEQCVEILQEELGVSPEEATEKLYEAVKQNRLRPSVPVFVEPLEKNQYNILYQATSFVGRQKELASIKRLLPGCRLLTLTGAGGCGKTRLAFKAAIDAARNFEHGVRVVQLAKLADSDGVLIAVARALNLHDQSGRPIRDVLFDFLRSRSMLIVLDNCEHLIEACSELAGGLLRDCRNIKLLVTSREAMNIAGEQVWRVPSLACPDYQAIDKADTSELIGHDAVALFLVRTKSALPEYRVTDHDACVAARICSRLDGIPLAIELAANRMKMLSAGEILKRLAGQFDMLTGGGRTALPRHRTVRATIDWSYNLLTHKEQILLRRVSWFMGGWSIEAAEAICPDANGADERPRIREREILDLLAHLADKSMLVVGQTPQGTRYRLLEMIRQYSREKLEASGEELLMARRHRDWYLDLVQTAEPELKSHNQLFWLKRLEQEQDNLRAAIEWCLSNRDPEAALRLVNALWYFWCTLGLGLEGRNLLEKALKVGKDAPALLRAKALFSVAWMAFALGNLDRSEAAAKSSLRLYSQTDDKEGMALSQLIQAFAAATRQQIEKTIKLAKSSLALFLELGDKWGAAMSRTVLGVIVNHYSDYEEAREQLEQDLTLCRQSGDKCLLIKALCNLGLAEQRRGHNDRARQIFEEGMALSEELGFAWQIGTLALQLGTVALRQNRYRDSGALLKKALARSHRAGHRGIVSSCFRQIACLNAAQECYAHAARIFGASQALQDQMKLVIGVSPNDERDQILSDVRGYLGDEAFAAEWLAGMSMDIEQAVEYAFAAAG